MTVAKSLAKFWKEHGTKILGTATILVSSALTVDHLVPVVAMPYFLYANAVLGALTVKRGFTNARAAS